ncbi:MAG: ChbG/HpnK family deacetylase [Planctomycetaceae bacterium]|jgi:predicted glycoside hydrolase/deacetylase ChbG (UPF0249 family)|nr:ChbG/HpnK family deacetylase [Planctomycetaceae bacterium]
MLTITADDIGFSLSRNRAVIDAAVFGTVTAASLMVNMPEAENACRLVQQEIPQLGIGLHFTLTSGRPVSPPPQIPLLVDEDGMFRSGFLSLALSLSKNAGQCPLFDQITIEFEAQRQRLDELAKRYSLRINHLDSHQHIHAIPPIGSLLEKTAHSRNLSLRLPREPYHSWRRMIPQGTFLPVGHIKKMILDFCTRNARTQELTFYFGVLNSGKMNSKAWQRILEIVRRHPDVPCEVNVHPGKASPQEAAGEPLCCSKDDRKFHCSIWRRRELDVLLDPKFKSSLAALLSGIINADNES